VPEFSRRTLLGWTAALTAGAFAAPLLPAALASAAAGTPPPLDSLTSDWMPPSTVRRLPAVSNFWGGTNVTSNVLGFNNFTLAPYIQNGSAGDLTVDGAGLATTESRWSAYELLRKATTAKGLTVQTAMRLAFESNRLLLRVTVSNPTAASVTSTFSVNLSPRIRKQLGTWSWGLPRPGDQNFTGRTVGTPAANVMVSDNSSAAVTVFAVSPAATLTASGAGGTAAWNLTLAAGATQTLNIVMAVGDTSTGQALVNVSDGQAVVNAANTTLQNFSTVFAAVATSWSARWTAAFTAGNTHYSGSLPVLSAENTANGNAMARLYYMSVLSLLSIQRTNLGPAFNTLLGRTGTFSGWDRIYPSGSPEYMTTAMYYWDVEYFSIMLTLLDPAMFRSQMEYWLGKNIHASYAIDCLSGNTIGPWYGPNDLAVFTCLLNYINYSGDTAFLQKSVNNKTILRHLTDIANFWKTLVPAGQKLADYGLNHNILEVLPKYINQIASVNAGNVWMMNHAADLQQAAGDTATATSLRSSANALLPEILALYAPGQGVWNCRHADGTLVAVRHVFDFALVGSLLADKLTTTQKTEMKNFVTTELLEGDWMRALSLSDSQAPVGRQDHGSTGAFDAWPAMTAMTFGRFGDYAGLRDQLVTYSGVTTKGPFTQAHEFIYPGTAISVPDRANLNPAQALTVSAWVNAASWGTEYWRGSIIAKDSWGGGAVGYVLRGGAGGRISFNIAFGGGYKELVTTATVPTGGWHHVAGVYDGATMKVYIDGVERGSQAQTGTIAASTGTALMVGNCPADSTRKFVGAIDEPRVYTRALSAAEITAAFQATSGSAGTQDAAIVLRVPTNNGGVVSTPDAAKLNPSQRITVSAWVNATSWGTDYWRNSVIAKDSWGGGDVGYVLRGGAGGRISFNLGIGGRFSDLVTTATVPTGGWHHVAGVYDGATMKVYIDGVERASKAQTGAISASTGTAVLVGDCPADSTRKFVGTINDARVYDRALTAAEITAKYAGGVAAEPATEPALALRLPFDEGTGATTIEAATGATLPIGASSWSTGRTGFGKALTFGGTVEAVATPAGAIMTYNHTCGGKFADVIISDLFGYDPDSATPRLRDPGVSRGINATFTGVRFKGASYTITASTSGVSITAG